MKKLPFKPTALRENKAPAPPSSSSQDQQNKDDENDDCLDLFRHSRQMAPILAAQHERKMMRKKQKQLEEEEERRRRRSIAEGKRPARGEILLDEEESLEDARSEELGGSARASATRDDEVVPLDEIVTSFVKEELGSREPITPPSKRSRRDSAPNSRSSKRQRSDDDIPEHPDHPDHVQLPRLSPYLQPSPTKQRAVMPASAPLISLDSGSDDDIKPILKPSSQHRRSSSLNEVVIEPGQPSLEETAAAAEDDDEFAEYVRKAEEQRKRNAALQSSAGAGSGGPVEEAAATHIIITSPMPNTYPACVKYQFDRQLKLVRNTWIAVQEKRNVKLPIEQNEDIILTWQRKKVYVFSTLLNLGIRPQGNGKLVVDENRRNGSGLIEGRSKVHFEAWTTEAFREMELEEERRQKKEGPGFLDEESEEEEEPAEAAEQVKLKVRLKARDLEEVKLTVLPGTTVETLANGFRRQRDIPSEKDVGIYFDGERLQEYDTMESAGVEDLDTLEVHIK